MGLPICGRLVAAGFAVAAFDIRVGCADQVRACGATWAADAATLAASADIVITVLPGAPEVDQAMAGASGMLAAMRPSACWLDLSSNDPRVARQLGSLASARGIAAVSAPMGGGVDAAESGDLTFFVSGAGAAVERIRPVLAALGGGISLLGHDAGAAHAAKLLANLLWFGQAIAATEALLLGQSMGLELASLRGALAASAGGSAFIDRQLGNLLSGDYLETFGLDRCVDELEITASLAGENGVPFELSGLVTRLNREALARFGAVDGELLVARLLEERAGTRLRLNG